MSGYKGMVAISAGGKFTLGTTGIDIRPSIVFHELWENYERTTNKEPYRIPLYRNGKAIATSGGDALWDTGSTFGAHFLAITAESRFTFRILTPGSNVTYTPPASSNK